MEATRKFILAPPATFDYSVDITQAGGAKRQMQITWRHKNREDVKDWINRTASAKPGAEVDLLLEVMADWEADAPLNTESLSRFLSDYLTGASDLYLGYMRGLAGEAQKNA